MDDKKMEGQKTVVAFVAGLLIGGLLVWVFSASGDQEPPESAENTRDEEMMEEDVTPSTSRTTPDTHTENTPIRTTTERTAGNFSFSVADQAAGNTVVLGDTVRFPTTQGWIVVHEDADGDLANALGAARYNTDLGLEPTTIPLLRATTAGNTYHVVYYSENGDMMFDLREDSIMTDADGEVLSSTFDAE